MRTVVYQSYRITDVPPWIGRCMGSVKAWALARGFDYAFIDDQLFDYVPAWYKERVGGHLLPITDLARLEAARELLEAGYERTVWVDAHVLVFRPDQFAVEVTEGYAFCQEVWLDIADGGRITCSRRVNNAVTVFTATAGAALAFFADAARTLVRNKPGPVGPWDVSTFFLTALHPHLHFPLLRSVGLFSLPVLFDIARGGGPAVGVYRQEFGRPVSAANLCSSLRGRPVPGGVADDAFYAAVVDRLLETRGEVVNAAPPPGPGT